MRLPAGPIVPLLALDRIAEARPRAQDHDSPENPRSGRSVGRRQIAAERVPDQDSSPIKIGHHSVEMLEHSIPGVLGWIRRHCGLSMSGKVKGHCPVSVLEKTTACQPRHHRSAETVNEHE
jgi:hypothetical protein